MADKKIQDITEQTVLTGNEETYGINGTSDIRIKLSTLKTWILTGFSVAFSAITGKPTTIGGYGITDAYTSSQIDAALSGKVDTSSLGSAAFMSGPGGSILGTNDAQNVTNKSISLGSNTVTGTMAQFDAAVSDGNIVYQGQALGTPASGNMDNCTADGTDKVGFRNCPINSQSANYTLVLSDAGKTIYHPSADTTPRTFTIPANSSVAYPIGTAITFINDTSAGVVTISITTDTLVLAGAGTIGSRTLAANGVATAMKKNSTSWIISGVNLT